MNRPPGRRRRAILEGCIPTWSTGREPRLTGRETLRRPDAPEQDARVELTAFFAGRGPCGPYRLTLPARRTRHLRLNELTRPEPLPRGSDFATVVESDVPIVVQHARLDSRQAADALMTTPARGDE